MPISPECNFIFLEENYPHLAHNACIAESCIYSDSHNCIMKIGILNEKICRILCDKFDIPINKKDNLKKIIHKLEKNFFTPEDAETYIKINEIKDISKSRNMAAHNFPKNEETFLEYIGIAKATLLSGYAISTQFYIRFVNPDYKFPKFHLPENDDSPETSNDMINFYNKANMITKAALKSAASMAAAGTDRVVACGLVGRGLAAAGKVWLPVLGGTAIGGLLGGVAAYAAGKGIRKAVKILPDSINEFFRDLDIDIG